MWWVRLIDGEMKQPAHLVPHYRNTLPICEKEIDERGDGGSGHAHALSHSNCFGLDCRVQEGTARRSWPRQNSSISNRFQAV
jgi:hypothetical protein